MKKGGGKAKGSAYQGRIAKKFEEYWGVTFASTPGSGGWARSKEFEVVSDLVCSDFTFPAVIECKKQEGWELDSLLKRPETNDWVAWWEQVTRDAHSVQKMPWLVFARNHFPDCIALRFSDIIPRLQSDHLLSDPSLYENALLINIRGELLYMTLLDHFFVKYPKDFWL